MQFILYIYILYILHVSTSCPLHAVPTLLSVEYQSVPLWVSNYSATMSGQHCVLCADSRAARARVNELLLVFCETLQWHACRRPSRSFLDIGVTHSAEIPN